MGDVSGDGGSLLSVSAFANSGATTPIYAFPTFPHAEKSGDVISFVFEGWDGYGRASQCTTCNELTGVWTPVLAYGYDPLIGDSHGHPSKCRDWEGYHHSFFGPHSLNPLFHKVTRLPDDLSAWRFEPQIGTSVAYSVPVAVGTAIYLFTRTYDVNTQTYYLALYKISSLSGGTGSLGAEIALVRFEGKRVYHGYVFLRNSTELHFICTQAEAGNIWHKNSYYLIYDTVTGALRNVDASHSTAAGSLPITDSDMDTYYKIISTPAGHSASFQSWCFDTSGNEHVLYTDSTKDDATGTDFKVYHIGRFSGVWSSPVQLGIAPSYSSTGCIVAGRNGEVFAFFVQDAGFVDGGSMYKAKRSAGVGGAWGATELLQAAGTYPLNEPSPVLNHPDGMVVFTEITPYVAGSEPDTSVGIGTMRLFAYNPYVGYLQRATIDNPTTWSISDKGKNPYTEDHDSIELTNGGLTFSSPTDSVTGKAQLRATGALGPSAKIYFEIVADNTTSFVGQYAIGISSRLHSLSVNENIAVGFDAHSAGYFNDGEVHINTTLVATLAGWVATNNISVAVDRVNAKIWFRKNGGSWNDSGTDSPATNAGGYSLSALGSEVAYPQVEWRGVNHKGTGKFKPSDWTYAAPIGFVAF